MPPRRPLAKVDGNVLTATTPAGKKASLRKENSSLKDEIASLTAQLEQAKLETTPSVTTTPTERKNPFGGYFPASAYPSIAASIPKRPTTAFQLFCKENRQEVKDQMPQASVQIVNAKLSEMWKALSEDEQVPFNAIVESDRERFTREREDFAAQKEKMEFERLAIEYHTREQKIKKALEFYEAHLEETKQTTPKSSLSVPKQPRSAYHIFAAIRHKELAQEKLPLGEASARVAEDWNKLQTSKAKRSKQLLIKCKNQADEEKDRFQLEMDEYNQKRVDVAAGEAREQEEFRKAAIVAYTEKTQLEADAKAYRKLMAEKKGAEKLERKKIREEKKAAKEARADEPTRPRNAYALFFSENSKVASTYIKENNVEHSMAKEIAERWKVVTEREKKKYDKLAEKDQLRYKKEMEAYKAKKDSMTG